MSEDQLDLEQRRNAASAMNRLSHALVRHNSSAEVLELIARDANRLAESIEQEPVRERRLEFVETTKFKRAKEAGGSPIHPEGAFVDAFQDSPVSGSANPLSIGLKIAGFADHVEGRVTLNPGWQGAPGRAHGGTTAAIVDEVFGALLPVLGIAAFTGQLTIRYVAPCPMGIPLTFRAHETGHDGRKRYFELEGSSAEGVFVTATAIFIETDLSVFDPS